MPLTVKQIEAAKFGISKERLGDGGGLYLRLLRSGRKQFQVLIPKSEVSKQRVWLPLGEFPDVSLKSARDAAGWARLQSRRGWSVDQIRTAIETGREDQSPTEPAGPADKSLTAFRIVAAKWFELKREGLKNGKHIDQNWNTVATYVLPSLGDRPVGQIARMEVVDALRPIWREKHETARRTLARVKEIFELAKLEYDVADNPADYAPKIAYGAVRRNTQHFGSLPWERMPEFWTWLTEVRCAELTRQYTMMIVLSAKRTSEVRFAHNSYFSPDEGAIWETPAEAMKMGKPHRVPMSTQLLTVLDNVRILTGGAGYLFAKPRTKRGVVSENVALNLVKNFDTEITAHGFRATFKGRARLQKRYERDAIEFALAHGLPPLDAAYFREDLLEERRILMKDWGDFVTGGEPVVKLRTSI
ncbi:integrase arm-type DNA-binding domain-containing protein [Paracoccus sp. TK19116]|uniref:Integrase arm-type DNA-binding domain-containing protein n=1 Tax=Paracoccus albicereus TaxID=2922394 RepID=A0ABT1MRQ9_9RHOB|nr:integrase arm-type DNA-binding domain-containing protein [Paracoccus albicereus]MCQ0969571.1 integrase arm-type DNA-binding domain-containing protein [Paracoccus albicereus]